MLPLDLLVLNFSAGVLVFFSPCGFPMLPAYVTYYVERQAAGGAPSGALAGATRGLGAGLLASVGALALLASVAALAVAFGSPFKRNVLLLELVGGIVVVAMGVLLLAGRDLSFTFRATAPRGGALGLVAFGALYAGVAAGCVAPLLISVVVQAISFPPADAAAAMGAYAAGFLVPLVVITAAVGAVGASAVAPLRRVLPWTKRAGGVLMLIVGTYLIVYWYRATYGVA